MRLSALVSQQGIAPFTFEDFLFVGSKVSTDRDRLILVGGQAIETWGVVFDVLAPTGNRHPLTEDTDWLGGKRDAQWLCKLLGEDATELKLASAHDHTPSVALAWLKRPDGRVLLMDFLHSIIGPSNEAIRRLAVPVKVGDFVLNVMHPLLCLESRLANLKSLPSKRDGNGRMQAEWAIDIVQAYINKILSDGDVKQARKACHKVAEQAEFQAGKFCFLHFNLDPMRAVSNSIVEKIGGKFSELDWPNTVSRVNIKREKWREVASRELVHVPTKVDGSQN